MDFIGVAINSMLSIFSPTCFCGATVHKEKVEVNENSSGYDLILVLNMECWLCKSKGRITLDFLRSDIYDLEGTFTLNENIQIKGIGKKQEFVTKITTELDTQAVVSEVLNILRGPR